MPQRIQQTRQQTRPKDIHVTAKRILQADEVRSDQSGGVFANERLSLRFVQTERGQQPPRFR